MRFSVRVRCAAAASALLLAALTACSDDAAPATGADGPADAPAASPSVSDEQQVRDLVDAYVDVLNLAVDAPGTPGLFDEVMVPAEAARLDDAYGPRAGFALEGEWQVAVDRVALDGARARALGCLDGSGVDLVIPGGQGGEQVTPQPRERLVVVAVETEVGWRIARTGGGGRPC